MTKGGHYSSATAATHMGGLVGVYGYTDDPTSYAIYGEGGMAATGSIGAVVATKSFGLRETYAIQSADNWCEDFGRATMVNGVARVALDPVFSETVRLDRDYYVYLTPLGDCGVYVAEKQERFFVVMAQDDRACTVDFDYRIVAKRIGFEDQRLRSADRIAETSKNAHVREMR